MRLSVLTSVAVVSFRIRSSQAFIPQALHALKLQNTSIHCSRRMISSTFVLRSTKKEEEVAPVKTTGHSVPESALNSETAKAVGSDTSEEPAGQEGLPQITKVEATVKMLQACTGYGVISTLGTSKVQGYPFGSVVGFALDPEGFPLFAFSTLSGHTRDLLADGRASLTVTEKEFQGASDGRVTLTGDISKIPADKIPDMKAIYKAKHPDAYWVDFNDFLWLRMTSIKAIRFVGGFAMAGDIDPVEYRETMLENV